LYTSRRGGSTAWLDRTISDAKSMARPIIFNVFMHKLRV